jgi:hypothetical protein
MMIGALPIRNERIADSSSGNPEGLKYMPSGEVYPKVGSLRTLRVISKWCDLDQHVMVSGATS